MPIINVNISPAAQPLIGELVAGELKVATAECISVAAQDTDASNETNAPAYFKFGLRQRVRLVESGERGSVMARSEDAEAVNQYRVRYRAADGRQQECWWSEEAIAAV